MPNDIPSTEIARLLDRAAIVALNDTFARALDGGTLASFLSVFTDDVDYRSGPRQLKGLGDLQRFFTERAAGGRVSRHMYSGIAIDFIGADEATGIATWLTFAGSGPLPINSAAPFLVADIADVYRRTASGWKIARRTITPVFRNPDIPPPVPAKS